MEIPEELGEYYRRLFRLLEQDRSDIRLGVGGEILEEYRKLITRELDMLERECK